MINKDSSKEVRKNIQLRFIDSCKSIVSSLDKLVFYLDGDQFKNLQEFFTGDEVSKLMRHKGFLFHKSIWIAGGKWKRPSCHQKNAFSSNINMKRISNNDHEHAQKV